VRIIHTIHNSHLEPPYDDPDGPINELWRRWFEVAGSFDAVLWPTAAQRDDVAARFGDHDTYAVVPNAVEQTPVRTAAGVHRVVMLNRLAAQKRVDHAIRAWHRVVDAVPDARLDVYGGGPLREQLQGLIDQLGLGASITLHGHVDDRQAVFAGASLFLASPAYEGQGLSTAEALARGIPAVSYDVRYGPRETIQDAGILVPSGDIDGLADAVIALLQDDERRASLAARAPEVVGDLAPDAVRSLLVAAIERAVSRPSHRSRS
jgi:glycosyltransferase involved in cell wall biosynthesis